MTDVDMNIEVEAEELAEELSDEALDREGACFGTGTGLPGCSCG